VEYLCSECSTQLSDFEIELNELYPVGKLYCEWCQSKHEREIIKKLSESLADLDFYDFDNKSWLHLSYASRIEGTRLSNFQLLTLISKYFDALKSLLSMISISYNWNSS